MYKKLLLIFFLIIVAVVFLLQRTVTFVYLNPYTATESFEYIAKTIKQLDKCFSYAKFSTNNDGHKIKYLYYNAYGSGFIKNNVIPNDLDFAIGVYLGKYKYDGKNATEIAESIIDTMNSLERGIIFYNNTKSDFYPTINLFENQLNIELLKPQWIKNFTESIDYALSNGDYISYVQKTAYDSKNNTTEVINIPFIINSDEILIHDRSMIKIYNDNVIYHPKMPLYEREISIIPEYFVDIEYKNKIRRVEIIAESTHGGRLQLKRKLFASCVFVHNFSVPFLKQMPYIKDDDEYLFYRFLSFRRHLQDISNLKVLNERSPKIFKRLAQTTDMIAPALDDDTYKEIIEYIKNNFDNRDVQLLNEYANICTNIAALMKHPNIFLKMINDGKIENMYNVLTSTTEELYERNNVSKEYLQVLTEFKDKTIKKLYSFKTTEEIDNYKKGAFEKEYDIAHDTWIDAMYSQYKEPDKVNKYIELFNNIFLAAGIHPIEIYWLNANTVGIIEDDFTKNIKDMNKFAKNNKLVKINYKLIKRSEVPKGALSSIIYVSYDPTDTEVKNYEKLKRQLLIDKQNFKIKRKIVLIK